MVSERTTSQTSETVIGLYYNRLERGVQDPFDFVQLTVVSTEVLVVNRGSIYV